MIRRSILSICALTAAGKGATLRRSFAVFALFPVLCLALVPARAAGIVDAAFVAEALKRGAIVWDARDAAAYQRGHIAGAVNIPYEENWADPDTIGKLSRREVANNRGMLLKSDADLRKLYSQLDANKETIVYCQSGVRSAETAAVLGKLGFRNVKVYDSSWLGYAAKLDAPVENEVFFNVGALRAQLTAMQAKIDALEKALAAMRAPAPK